MFRSTKNIGIVTIQIKISEGSTGTSERFFIQRGYARYIGHGVYIDYGVGFSYYYNSTNEHSAIDFFDSNLWPSLMVGFHSD